jgi:hypothetical protein
MLRIFWGMMVVAGMALAQPAMAADWSGAPKFCEPKSAARWSKIEDREPCHCPPQSQCPKPINVAYSELTFYIAQYWDSYTISGSDVPALKNGSVAPMQVFSMNGDQLINLLGINRNADRNGNVTWHTHITVVSNAKASPDELLKLPLPIVNQCCDSPCPAGTTLQVKDLQVTKPYPPDFGLLLDAAKVDNIKKALDDLALALKPINNSADLIDLTKEIGTALDTYFDKPGDNTRLTQLIKESGLFNTLADKLPLGFRQDNKTTLDEISGLNESAKEELDKRTKPPEMVTVNSLTCAAPDLTKDADVMREGCILSGTRITLADGTTKPIESLNVGDQLQGHNGVGVILAKSKFSQREDTMYSINKGEAFFTVEHPILTTQGWKSVDANVTSAVGDTIIVGSLAVGDVLLLAGGKELTVTSIDKKPLTNGVDAYNLSLTGDGSFIAQGFIMKGFKKMQMHY